MNYSRLLAVLFLMYTALSYAQETSEKCKAAKSYYYRALKTGQYQEAALYWQMAVNECGPENLDEAIYINGNVIYSNLLKEVPLSEESDPADQQKRKNYLDTIGWIYQKHFDLSGDLALTEKYVNLLVKENAEKPDKIISLYESLVPELGSSLRPATVMYFYKTLLQEFSVSPKGEKVTRKHRIFEKYAQLTVLCHRSILSGTSGDDNEHYTRSMNYLNRYTKQLVSSCEDFDSLVSHLNKRLSSEHWSPMTSDFVNKLSVEKGCLQSEVYLEILKKAVNDTSYKSLKQLGGIYFLREEYDLAIEIYNKATQLNLSNEKEDELNYQMAASRYALGQYKSAYRTAKKVEGEKKGEACKLIAEIIAEVANSCGVSTFQRKSNYWLANDFIKKAINHGMEGVNKEMYLQHAPTERESFLVSIEEGDVIEFECWDETTKARWNK